MAVRSPVITLAALARPSYVAAWSSWLFMPVSVVALSARRPDCRQATRAHRNKPVGAHQIRRGRCKPQSPMRHKAPLATGDPCVSTIGAPFRCCDHAPGAARCEGSVTSCRPVHVPRDSARGSAVCAETGVFARQGMMASTVFFSALGWAGDLGAFCRARSSLAPICCSCLRPSASSPWGTSPVLLLRCDG